MTNLTVAAFYAPFAISCAFFTIYTLRTGRCGRLSWSVAFFAGAMLCWNICEILFYLVDDRTAVYLFDLKLPFVAAAALAMFFLVMRFYHFDHYLTARLKLVFAVIPIITAVFAITSGYHDFLLLSISFDGPADLRLVTRVRGVWFWVHAVYCYFFTLFAMGLSIKQHFRLPKIYRTPSRLLILLMIITVVGNLLVLVRETRNLPFDYSLIGANIGVIISYFSCISNKGLDFLHHARNSIFNNLSEGVLTLDDEGNIISRNRVAKKLMLYMAIDSKVDGYPEILEKAALAADTVRHSEIDPDGVDYYVTVKDEERIFNLRQRDILDKRRRMIGKFVICSEVTENRRLIRSLETDAGMDALTGLLNHRKMQEFKAQLNKPEHYPLSVIMGDLNFLKIVNDTMGHQQGDVLLRAASSILLTSCPPNARVGRVGGDEFLVLLPGVSEAQCRGLIKSIQKAMEEAEEYPFEVSMAFGTATKDFSPQTLDEVIAEADTKMYKDKRESKKARTA